MDATQHHLFPRYSPFQRRAIHKAWDIPPIRVRDGNPFISTNAKGHRPQAVEGGEPSDFRQPPDRFTGEDGLEGIQQEAHSTSDGSVDSEIDSRDSPETAVVPHR